MTEYNQKPKTYIYTYSRIEDEVSLCRLEMRSLFGIDTESTILESTIKVDPNRSPFIKERIDLIYEAESLDEMIKQVENLKVVGRKFKVIFVKNSQNEKVGFADRRDIERKVGLRIQGDVDLKTPELLFGIMKVNGRWLFGKYHLSEPIWLKHQKKPHNYSTALSTRVARAVVNIAVPLPSGIKVIDPCCGIGTVLIEALSMGIDVVGSDYNPLVLPGVRENISFFGLETEVTLKNIRDVTGSYDVAIIDMPYNLCSVLEPKEQLEMLQSARRFAKKLVVITIESIDHILVEAGFVIVDRGLAKKNTFTRQIIVCE